MTKYEEELHGWLSRERLWQDLEGKTVMVTGASGMVGKCLTDLFMMRRRIRVIAVSRNERRARERFSAWRGDARFRYVSCDVNSAIPECGPVDYIIHGASHTHPRLYAGDPIGTIAANVFGTRNLLDYGISHGMRRFCFVSSVEIYGENRGDRERFDESYMGYLDCNTLRADYPESKRLGESLCSAYREAYGTEYVIPRLSRVYGPTMLESDSKAVSQFIRRAAKGENIVLKSDGTPRYSYTFVTDAAAGIVWTLAVGRPGEAYNVVDQESDMTLGELAERLAHIAGSRVVFERPEETERKGYSAATKALMSGDKLARIGWKARVHMEEGLFHTVEQLKNNGFQTAGE